jgi:hypothetical protein
MGLAVTVGAPVAEGVVAVLPDLAIGFGVGLADVLPDLAIGFGGGFGVSGPGLAASAAVSSAQTIRVSLYQFTFVRGDACS